MAATKSGISLSLLILILFSTLVSAQTRTKPADDRVTIRRRTITLIRSREIAKKFPLGRKAVISYPVISGLRNQEVLRKVRAIIEFKNVFERTVDEYREDSWLQEINYRVGYNQNYILDLTFRQTGTGAYTSTDHQHFTIDLRRGTVVKASDVFVVDKLQQLAAVVDQKLQHELKESTLGMLKSGDISASELRDLHAELKFGIENLNNFEVKNFGLVFLYDAGFAHVDQPFAPDGRYRFTYKELKPYLKPDGLLWQFVD